MNPWSPLTVDCETVEALAQVIRAEGRPVHVNVLARAAVRAHLQQVAERRYAPGAQYMPCETIWLDGQRVAVRAVQPASNPRQGAFKILTLVLPDGSKRYMAAEIPGAQARDTKRVPGKKVRSVVEGEDALAIRTAVRRAAAADVRFACFQDAQGDHCCLEEMLPAVEREEFTRAWPLLEGLFAAGVIRSRPIEELVMAVWGQENDGSKAYPLMAFALNVALERSGKARWLGDGWALESQWGQLQARRALVAPRQSNEVELPPGVKVDSRDDSPGENATSAPDMGRQADAIEEDLEAWRARRRAAAEFTLAAAHFYGNWLPLTQDLRRVFPPVQSRSYAVTFYHRFGTDQSSFQAWVSWHQGRIIGSPALYQALYEHDIYPGARLVVSHRGNLWEYDIQTKPAVGEQRLRVRRVFLSSDVLQYEEVEEPLRYQVDGDVFVAAARWEDLPALFRQAEEAGAGIFQLMYEQCREWWEASGRRPLHVTPQQLFHAIHFDDEGRLTSPATIAWELWRRLAFLSAGGGRYLFRPEKGDAVRSVAPSVRASGPEKAPRDQTGQKRPPPEGIRAKPPTPIPTERSAAGSGDGQLHDVDPGGQEARPQEEPGHAPNRTAHVVDANGAAPADSGGAQDGPESADGKTAPSTEQHEAKQEHGEQATDVPPQPGQPPVTEKPQDRGSTVHRPISERLRAPSIKRVLQLSGAQLRQPVEACSQGAAHKLVPIDECVT